MTNTFRKKSIREVRSSVRSCPVKGSYFFTPGNIKLSVLDPETPKRLSFRPGISPSPISPERPEGPNRQDRPERRLYAWFRNTFPGFMARDLNLQRYVGAGIKLGKSCISHRHARLCAWTSPVMSHSLMVIVPLLKPKRGSDLTLTPSGSFVRLFKLFPRLRF